MDTTDEFDWNRLRPRKQTRDRLILEGGEEVTCETRPLLVFDLGHQPQRDELNT